MKGLKKLFLSSIKLLEMQRLKYDIMEKQAYALVKELKYFIVYVLHSKIIAYVSRSNVKDMFV
jgi:hypothetical protein